MRSRSSLAPFAFALIAWACHRTAPVKNPADDRVVKDRVRDRDVVKDTSRIVSVFEDTLPTRVLGSPGQTFRLRTAAQRESFRAALRKERDLWRARRPRDYRFLLRVDCFCPGRRGWLLIEVRGGKIVRASDAAGKSVTLSDWNTFSIDDLYDNLDRSADRDSEVQIAFDQRWHHPTSVRTSVLPGPDSWSIVEARQLRPL